MASPLRPKNVPGSPWEDPDEAELVMEGRSRHPNEERACGLCLREGKGRFQLFHLPKGKIRQASEAANQDQRGENEEKGEKWRSGSNLC